MFSSRNTTLRELLGDPFTTPLDNQIFEQAFLFRLIIVVPLVTIPTAILLRNLWPLAYSPFFAEAGRDLWIMLALGYLVTNITGVALYLNNRISSSLLEFLNLLCLVIEVSLTTVATYLLGSDALSFSSFVTVLVVGYRLYFNYRFGLLSAVLSSIGWLLLAGQESLGLQPGPILSAQSLTSEIQWVDCVFACGLVFCGFVTSNVGANRIHKLRVKLEATQNQLLKQARSAAVGNLITGIAHELGNPLNLVQGGIENLSEVIHEKSPDEVIANKFWLKEIKASIAVAEKGSHRINTLMRSLNDLSLTHGASTNTCELSETLSFTLNSLEDHLSQGSHQLTTNIPEEFKVQIPTNELAQLLFNLILNAVQAMEKPGDICIVAALVNKQVQIDISDTGPGIPLDVQDQVFDAFMTTHAHAKGLGLTISQQIANANNGSIKLMPSSAGACFRIHLPHDLEGA